MTPAEWIGSGAAIFAALCTIATMLYTRGKLDAHATHAGQKIDALGVKIDALETARLADGQQQGAQNILNANAAQAGSKAEAAHQLAIKVEERQTAHERGCDRRQGEINDRLEHMTAEIRNLALGLANNVQQIPANRRTAP